MIGARLDYVVGFWGSSCIGVSSVVPSVLRTSKASHDNISCSQSGGIVRTFGKTPVAKRQVTTARIIPPGVGSTRRGDGAPIECQWEEVALKPSRDLGEICEVESLSILE